VSRKPGTLHPDASRASHGLLRSPTSAASSPTTTDPAQLQGIDHLEDVAAGNEDNREHDHEEQDRGRGRALCVRNSRGSPLARLRHPPRANTCGAGRFHPADRDGLNRACEDHDPVVADQVTLPPVRVPREHSPRQRKFAVLQLGVDAVLGDETEVLRPVVEADPRLRAGSAAYTSYCIWRDTASATGRLGS